MRDLSLCCRVVFNVLFVFSVVSLITLLSVSFFSVRLTLLERTIAKGGFSVCLSVCQACEPRLHGSGYPYTVCTK